MPQTSLRCDDTRTPSPGSSHNSTGNITSTTFAVHARFAGAQRNRPPMSLRPSRRSCLLTGRSVPRRTRVVPTLTAPPPACPRPRRRFRRSSPLPHRRRRRRTEVDGPATPPVPAGNDADKHSKPRVATIIAAERHLLRGRRRDARSAVERVCRCCGPHTVAVLCRPIRRRRPHSSGVGRSGRHDSYVRAPTTVTVPREISHGRARCSKASKTS
jgi:hypothetical protein